MNITLGVFHILTELLILCSLQVSLKSDVIFTILLWLRILSWCNMYVNILPFKYLVPTLFAKNFKLYLNIFIWFWYGVSIWNSPVLQYLYHQIYHTSSADCIGEGLAVRCILLKDGQDHKHFKTLRKAYLEVKLANGKFSNNLDSSKDNASVTAFQAIKCVMTLKRKLRRIRQAKDLPTEEESASIS
ncbi:unnamed protein product [Hermetia illucens]|uniref:Uncharacterized protein n=2 Tax=Hermetia illucens TaxID=343691 RepID=A0A7R8V2Q1_HERIL|nr:unnamed protein product [Hermetia illucens]